MSAITELSSLLKTMTPTLNPGCFVFVTVSPDYAISPCDVIASIQEPEGLTLVLAQEKAAAYGLKGDFLAAWLTLTVHSDLQAVGLTAAFSQALGQAQISCNVIAGYYHDHIFVPYEKAELAKQVLTNLQEEYQNRDR